MRWLTLLIAVGLSFALGAVAGAVVTRNMATEALAVRQFKDYGELLTRLESAARGEDALAYEQELWAQLAAFEALREAKSPLVAGNSVYHTDRYLTLARLSILDAEQQPSARAAALMRLAVSECGKVGSGRCSEGEIRSRVQEIDLKWLGKQR